MAIPVVFGDDYLSVVDEFLGAVINRGPNVIEHFDVFTTQGCGIEGLCWLCMVGVGDPYILLENDALMLLCSSEM